MASFLAGCVSFSPRPLQEIPFKERVQTGASGGLTVAVAVPTIAEARSIYGVDLESEQIQPIWLEVTNHEEQPYWFLASGLDANHFTPSEAAYAFHGGTSGIAAQMDEHFEKLAFKNPVLPGKRVSGFVLVNLDEGYKAVDIDLISRDDARSFTFVFVDPDFRADVKMVDLDALWPEEGILTIEKESDLPAALARLPRCTTNKGGDAEGDPLNLVLVGERAEILAAMVRRGWHATEFISTASVWRTIKSFFLGSRYRYSPISPLYVFGRHQDFSAQKARGSVNERNHLRLWLTPMRFRKSEVWVGQISRDIGVMFTTKSPTIATHKIDPDVDEARRYLIEDLAYSQAMVTLGFIEGVGKATMENSRYNLGGDPYFTDGCRAVMFFGPRPNSLDEIRILEWATPGQNEGEDSR